MNEPNNVVLTDSLKEEVAHLVLKYLPTELSSKVGVFLLIQF